jgi:hypothetical protein
LSAAAISESLRPAPRWSRTILQSTLPPDSDAHPGKPAAAIIAAPVTISL